MFSFDDFDAWGAAINGAHLRLACDAVERRRWTLGSLQLGGVVLQVASEGGGNICYGGNAHSGPLLFVPLTRAAEHVVNGEPLDDDSVFGIPHGADFSIRIRRRAHAWCSVALPAEAPFPLEAGSGSTGLACRPGSVDALRRLVYRITATLLEQAAGTAAHEAAGADLRAAVSACLPTAPHPPHPPRPPRAAMGRPRLDRAAIIRRSMEVIEAGPTLPKAADLAHAVGVTDRTLLRTFRETFDIPPKRYLLLRELHAIRRILLSGAASDATVADVLTRHGIWEFGRFAGRYRAHFGELPSRTLARARA